MRGISRLAVELTVSQGDLSFTDSVNLTHVFQILVGFQTFFSNLMKILYKLYFPNPPPPQYNAIPE